MVCILESYFTCLYTEFEKRTVLTGKSLEIVPETDMRGIGATRLTRKIVIVEHEKVEKDVVTVTVMKVHRAFMIVPPMMNMMPAGL